MYNDSHVCIRSANIYIYYIYINVWVCEIAPVGRVVPDMIYVYFGSNDNFSCFNSHYDFPFYAPVRKHTSAIKDRTRANYVSYI